ncbi:recombinase family protein [Nocardiopsis oceani]
MTQSNLPSEDPLRFALWARVSTDDLQDPEASRAWQRTRAEALIGQRGQIVTEFFDMDKSRSVPPRRRPQGSRLLRLLEDPDRGFDAVVVGEPQRVFYDAQFNDTFPLFHHFRVPLWVPEVGGAIDSRNEAHTMIMSVFGGTSKGERTRIQVRVQAAMAAQAKLEGRWLGGRPPYGYMLQDAGPHPNPAKAADGKRMHRMVPDPVTRHVVQRIFADFLCGLGIFAIAEMLTSEGIPSPSAHDRRRNPHRTGLAWSKNAIRAILKNPRYTGHQVWNKQHKSEELLDVRDVSLGYTTKLRWNDQDQWVVSNEIVHEPLVSDEDFAQAQRLLEVKGRRAVTRRPRSTGRVYPLRSRLHCGLCNRRMQGSWNNQRPYYRCTFPNEYAMANHVAHPRSVYLKEDDVLPVLDDWLARLFEPTRREETLRLLTESQQKDETGQAVKRAAEEKLAECDTKLSRYRAALESGTDPEIVGEWIREVKADRALANAQLKEREDGPQRLEANEIEAHLEAIGDFATMIREADREAKSALYTGLDLRLTYHPVKRVVRAEADLNSHEGRNMYKLTCPRGDLNPHSLNGH